MASSPSKGQLQKRARTAQQRNGKFSRRTLGGMRNDSMSSDSDDNDHLDHVDLLYDTDNQKHNQKIPDFLNKPKK